MGNKKNKHRRRSQKRKCVMKRKARREEKKRKDLENNQETVEGLKRNEEKMNGEIILQNEIIGDENRDMYTNLRQYGTTENRASEILNGSQEVIYMTKVTESHQEKVSSPILLSENNSKNRHIKVEKTISTYHLVPCTNDEFEPDNDGGKAARITYKKFNTCNTSDYTYLKVSEFESTDLVGLIGKEDKLVASKCCRETQTNDYYHNSRQVSSTASEDIYPRLSAGRTHEMNYRQDLGGNWGFHISKVYSRTKAMSGRKTTKVVEKPCFGNNSNMKYYRTDVQTLSDCCREFNNHDIPLIHDNIKFPSIKTYGRCSKKSVKTYSTNFKLRRTNDATQQNYKSEGV